MGHARDQRVQLLNRPPAKGPLAISIVGLTKLYKNKAALDNVSLSVPRGSVFGLLGPNGAGKTTLIRVLLGLARRSAGQVEVFGRPPKSPGFPVGCVLESRGLYPWLSARAHVKVYARAQGLPQVDSGPSLERVGLDVNNRRPIATYSTGMRQRLALALALLGKPSLLILDEPTNGLDPLGARDIRRLLREVSRTGTTLLLSSHTMTEVERLCTEVAVLKSGKVVYVGGLSEMLRSDTSRIEVDALETASRLLNEAGVAHTCSDGVLVVADCHVSRAIQVLAGTMHIRSVEPAIDLEEIFVRLVTPTMAPE